jgi:hypothetical protein
MTITKVNDLSHTKDPRGLVQRDIDHLVQVFKVRPVKPSMTQNEIMFQAGQQDVIRYIMEKLVS